MTFCETAVSENSDYSMRVIMIMLTPALIMLRTAI